MNNPTFYKLIPAYQHYLWGGSKLKDDYGKLSNNKRIAESWECSTHEHGLTLIDGLNITLDQHIKDDPSILGTHCPNGLPILVKFIDAYANLSVQVHPDDNYAKQRENGQNGKTEMWYVVEASKDAQLIYGFYENVTKQQIITSINDGSIDKYLQKVKVNSDDVFLIEPGLVHAIGKGCLIVEIQQNSDLTYRLYDYDRKDDAGNKRQLHIDKALDVANLNATNPAAQPLRVLRYYPGFAKELLGKTQYFMVHRLLVNSSGFDFSLDQTSFALLVCIQGSASLSKDNYCLNVTKGDSVLVEANQTLTIQGNARFIMVTC